MLRRAAAAAAAAALLPRASSSARSFPCSLPRRAAEADVQQQLLLLLLGRRSRRGFYTDRQGYEYFDKPPRASPRVAVLAGATAAGGVAYWWSCREEVPYTHRRHAIMFVSPAMERHIGEQTFAEVTQQAAASRSLLPARHPAVELVKRVGLRVAKVASDGAGGGYNKHMQNLNWEFAVIDSKEVNAFVVPGGKVVVYTGLMRLMSSEDELAAVLAHEAAHVVARHHAERMSQLNATGLANMLARAMLGITIPGPLVVLGLFLPHSRAAEYEADAIGVRLLARACFDPQANVSMLAKLQAQDAAAAAPPELLSTHPLTQERVARVRALLPEAFRLRQESCHSWRGAFAEAWGSW